MSINNGHVNHEISVFVCVGTMNVVHLWPWSTHTSGWGLRFSCCIYIHACANVVTFLTARNVCGLGLGFRLMSMSSSCSSSCLDRMMMHAIMLHSSRWLQFKPCSYLVCRPHAFFSPALVFHLSPCSLCPTDQHISEMDPDAPTRQSKSLHPDNAKAEARLMQRLWQLVRAGESPSSVLVCCNSCHKHISLMAHGVIRWSDASRKSHPGFFIGSHSGCFGSVEKSEGDRQGFSEMVLFCFDREGARLGDLI